VQAFITDSVRLVALLSDNDISLICLSDTDHYLMDRLSTVASFCVSDSPIYYQCVKFCCSFMTLDSGKDSQRETGCHTQLINLGMLYTRDNGMLYIPYLFFFIHVCLHNM